MGCQAPSGSSRCLATKSAEGMADVVYRTSPHTPQLRHGTHRLFLSELSRVEKYLGNMASALEGCVASLRGSMQNLDSTINILDDGVSDMPRLAKVLQTTRVRANCTSTKIVTVYTHYS